MSSRRDKERGPGESPGPDKTAGLDTDTTESTAYPDAGCVICALVADTRREMLARFRRNWNDLVRCASLARTLDYAGTHLEGISCERNPRG
jgi:hypothetical protein